MRPRIALSAVVLPAPLGPMSPRMRPSSIRKSMPSSAMVVPKTLRRPRASIHDIASGLLFCGRRFPAGRDSIQQFLRCQPKPLNGCVDPGPLFRKKLPALALQQQIARAGIDEHAATSPALDKLLVDQLLIALQNREGIDPVFGRDIAHGRQRIAFLEYAVEDHGDDTVAKLAVNRLTVVPLSIHNRRSERLLVSRWTRGRLRARSSYGAVRVAVRPRRSAPEPWTILIGVQRRR